jgi:hypothetical protein
VPDRVLRLDHGEAERELAVAREPEALELANRVAADRDGLGRASLLDQDLARPDDRRAAVRPPQRLRDQA